MVGSRLIVLANKANYTNQATTNKGAVMNLKEIDPNTVLAFNLISRTDYIEKLKADIENWKTRQVEQAHSASAIRYYAELVYSAREELERLGA